ncbi:MAG: protealysin inhibitor emfourin [Chloroflexota bacterium]
MISRRIILGVVSIVALLLMAACDSGVQNTPTSPPPAAATITLETSGGIAGIHKVLTIDPTGAATYSAGSTSKTGQIPPADHNQMLQQLTKADFFNLKDTYDNGNVADDFYYKITVKQTDKAKTVTVAEVGGKDLTPQALQDLITQLNSFQDTLVK